MKRLFYVLFFSAIVILSLGSKELMAVKLKNVSQIGTGNSGSVKIEFNNDYNKSDISVSYAANRVDLLIPNAFVVPVKRIFKSSSSKSSVTKMEAANISGKSLKLSIHFRDVPIDTIKKTAKLTGNGNVVSFNYGTVVEEPVAAVKPQVEKQEPPAVAPVPVASNMPDKVENKATFKKAEEPIKAVTEQSTLLSNVKKYAFALAKFFKVAMLVVLLGLVVFALFYIVRKYSGNSYITDPTTEKIFGSTKINNNPVVNPGIKIVSSLEMEKGKTLYVIEVMGERMLIASGKDYTNMLSRLDNDSKDGQEYLFNDTNEQIIMKTRLKDKLSSI